MPFFSVLPVLVNQWHSILSRKTEVNGTDSVCEALGKEDENLTGASVGEKLMDSVVEQTPKPEPYCETRDKEVALEAQLAKLMEENQTLVLANKHLENTVEILQLEVMEADNGRECTLKQIVGLQSELLKKERELQSAEQRIKDMAVANREREEHMDDLMAQHAMQLDDIMTEKAAAVEFLEHYKIKMEEQRLQHESEIVKLRTLAETEFHARQHLTNIMKAMQLEVTEACNEREYARQQILELQDKVLKRENELRRAEQFKNDVAAANRGRAAEIRQLLEQHARQLDQVVFEKDAFAQRMANQHQMEMQKKQVQHGIERAKLLSQLHASNVTSQELAESQATIVKMRAVFYNLLEKRDQRLAALQARISELEALKLAKAPEQDVGEVAPNYYKILGLQRNFNPTELKKAYHKKCLLHHPDKHGDLPDKERQAAMFKTVKYGYEVLLDSKSRTAYDEWLDMGEVRLAHQAR